MRGGEKRTEENMGWEGEKGKGGRPLTQISGPAPAANIRTPTHSYAELESVRAADTR